MKAQTKPLVGIIMGSDSDWSTLKAAADICEQFSVAHEVHVVSAHRTPDDMAKYAKNAYKKGLKVIIAGAGGAAHLPGMVASQTPLPVIGVPVKTEALSGMDSLLSIVQMPGGVPVATVAIGAGKNAGILAVEILATSNAKLMDKLIEYKKDLAIESRNKDKTLNKSLKK
ncbi:MAG: 5-(carboxyamino)imidazole ribonucleotide mutase [Gammaproteobacteria bacterium]|jgi:5-(carboxyamino)imidazole ribonucleotide mutase